MIYINSLSDLNPKVAEIEIVPIIRELKKKYNNEISLEDFEKETQSFQITKVDTAMIQEGLDQLRETIKKLFTFLDINSYEKTNILRTYNNLTDIYKNLENNLQYSNDLREWQENSTKTIHDLLTKIPKARSNPDKIIVNNEISQTFKAILKNDNFAIDTSNIIDEAEISKLKKLSESIKEGFLFRTDIQDFIKKNSLYCNIYKVDPEKLKKCENNSISKEDIARIDDLLNSIGKVKEFVELTYKNNMKILNLAIFYLACVRFISQQSL